MSTTARETVTVVIPTQNVIGKIRPVLDSVRFADVVLLIDMFSTDGTEKLGDEYPNVRVVQRNDYIFANVNYGMQLAETDWVIRLDSDEVLNPELVDGIVAQLNKRDPSVNCCIFPSVQYMFSQPMRWGVGLPERNVRKCMFRRGTAHYECKSEHEDITLTGTGSTITLPGFYEHFTNHNTAEITRKYCYYAAKDAERYTGKEAEPQPVWRVAYRAIRMFVFYYFQLRGYKDGLLGFYSSLFRGPVNLFIYESTRWEAWERNRKGNGR